MYLVCQYRAFLIDGLIPHQIFPDLISISLEMINNLYQVLRLEIEQFDCVLTTDFCLRDDGDLVGTVFQLDWRRGVDSHRAKFILASSLHVDIENFCSN